MRLGITSSRGASMIREAGGHPHIQIVGVLPADLRNGNASLRSADAGGCPWSSGSITIGPRGVKAD